jgi:hypothetical protein
MQARMQSATRSTAAVHIMPVIRVYDAAGNVIETHDHTGDFKEPFVRSRHLTIIQNRIANPRRDERQIPHS